MMNILALIISMVFIGALIGGITNFIAIKMLFRPHQAKYIGRFKLPFTPGLIPRRQKEIAEQLGKTVVQHLLTPEGISKKLLHDQFVHRVSEWLVQEIKGYVEKNHSIGDTLQQLQIPVHKEKLEHFTSEQMKKKIDLFIMKNENEALSNLLPEELITAVKRYIPKVSEYILFKLAQFVSSKEGKEKIGRVAEDFLDRKGFFGNMISSFLGGDGLAKRLEPAIHLFLQSKDSHQLLNEMLEKECNRFLQKNMYEFFPLIQKHEITEKVAEQAVQIIDIERWLGMKWADVYEKHEQTINLYLIKALSTVRQYLLEKIPFFMEKLKLKEIVQDEVERFDLKRLEQLVLGITSREFKMITYLGALLGGLIGFVQAFIAILIF